MFKINKFLKCHLKNNNYFYGNLLLNNYQNIIGKSLFCYMDSFILTITVYNLCVNFELHTLTSCNLSLDLWLGIDLFNK